MKAPIRRFAVVYGALLGLFTLLTGCQPVQRLPANQTTSVKPAKSAQEAANKAVVQRFYAEVVNQKQLELFKEDFDAHLVPSPAGFAESAAEPWRLTILERDAPAASICPTNASTAARDQQQATKVVGYLLGGENPLRGAGCNYSACANLAAAFSASQCVLSSAVPGNVRGLQAGLIAVECNAMEAVAFAEATACAAQLDACFGGGVSDFFLPIRNKTNAHVFELDPEPVSLVQPIGSTTGATAAAVYVNSGLGTTAIKWPSTYTGGGNLPPAGTPCTTGAANAGTITYKVIVASGNYRKCM